MNRPCKPGDKAIIAKPRNPKNFGKMVHVDAECQQRDDCWLFTLLEPAWGTGWLYPAGATGHIRKFRLIPLTDPDSDETPAVESLPTGVPTNEGVTS